MKASPQALWAAVRRIPDVVLAAGLLIAAQVELLVVGPVAHRLIVTLAAFGLTVPFVWWHRWPILVLAAVPTTFLIQTGFGVPPNAQVIGPVVWALASFGAAAFTPLRTALLGLLVVAVPSRFSGSSGRSPVSPM